MPWRAGQAARPAVRVMDGEAPRKTSFTYELTEDQQELLLGIMVNGNFRRREVP